MKFFIWFLAIWACSNGFEEGNRDESTPVVKVKYGRLRGIKEKSLNGKEFSSFMGIPFAEPPVGNLRFQDPVEITPWKVTLDASEISQPCPQAEFFQMMDGQEVLIGKEDCLYLNVYTPQPNKPRMNLPVMVYIHGGAFFGGSSELYRPYVLLNEDIVLVVIQYRLGIFGFLSTEDETMPGNLGIKDQIMALKWVKENIKNFGGDPDKVTIFGESAGGASAHILMLSPAAKGLFHNVIAQSGSALCPWANTKNHKWFAKAVGEEFNCPLELGTESYMKCLREVDAASLVNFTSKTVKYGLSPLYTAPRVDGDIIPEEPEILLKAKNYNRVNLMTGTTRDEGSIMFLFFNPQIIQELQTDFKSAGTTMLFLDDEEGGKETAQTIYDHYLQGKEFDIKESADDINKMFGDRTFTVCHDLTSALHTQDEEISVYRYELTHRGQMSLLDFSKTEQAKNWVCHGDDIFYLFSGGSLLNRPFENEEDQKLQAIMTKLWTNFARTGNPTPDQSLNFTWYKATSRNFEHLNLNPHPKMAKDKRRKIRQFYRSLNTLQNRILFPDGDEIDILSLGRDAQKYKNEL